MRAIAFSCLRAKDITNRLTEDEYFLRDVTDVDLINVRVEIIRKLDT